MSEFDDITDDDDGIWQPKPTLDDALKRLEGKEKPHLRREILDGLSDLSTDDIRRFDAVWVKLEPAYRRQLLRALVSYSEVNFEMHYRAIGILALKDTDPAVREVGIELLWEDHSLEVPNHLIQMASKDPVAEVRAAAANGLSRYVYLGEMEEIPEQDVQAAQDVLIRLLQDPQEPISVQRRALEAIANSSHPIVAASIEDAYRSGNHLMQVSAIFAMGRSCDGRWQEIIFEELENEDQELRFEAVRAAGELRMRDAVPRLGKLIAEGDREVIEMAVWSLGEIGGKEAVRILEALAEVAEEDDDDDLLEAIDDAIANTALVDMLLDEDDLANLYGLDD